MESVSEKTRQGEPNELKALYAWLDADLPGNIVAFPNPSTELREACLLARIGDGEARARAARRRLRSILHDWLNPFVSSNRDRVVMTTMPERFNRDVEHTFVSFTRELAQQLGIECVNDRFVETAPRKDVSTISAGQREQLLREKWVYRGSLAQKYVILLDDVVNSGASINVARECLSSAGGLVVPIALIKSTNEDAEVAAVLHKHYKGAWGQLLALPSVQGSLRESIQQWAGSAKPPLRAGS